MSAVEHVSMRVPWQDRPWDGGICYDPLNNSSCTLLANIGRRRDDAWEVANAGRPIDEVDHDKLPCLSERASFMSPRGYSVVKEHPYAWSSALAGIEPSPVTLPPYAFEALPFRWLSRESFHQEIDASRVPTYNPEAEDAALTAMGWSSASWLMDGENQLAAIQGFFDSVEPDESLVFVYLKHSPLQEERTDRLLLGAARVTRVTLPGRWRHTGTQAFESSMWETVLEHSLRPTMNDGILLPYHEVLRLLDNGADVADALAWAPEGRDVEFSYVTEHVSDDAALEALGSLRKAAEGMQRLGIEVPESALAWLDGQTDRLWQLRGPTPGLAPVLGHLGVERPHLAARAVVAQAAARSGSGQADDPWHVLEQAFTDLDQAPPALRHHLTTAVAGTWRLAPPIEKDALKILSALDVSRAQVEAIMLGEHAWTWEITLDEIVENPYFLATCTHTDPLHVPFATIDRACFQPPHVTWKSLIPEASRMDGTLDRRRVEALIVDVVEARAVDGDTLVPLAEVLAAAQARALTRPPTLNRTTLRGIELLPDGLDGPEAAWSPLVTATLETGENKTESAFKLRRLADTADSIRAFLSAQRAQSALGGVADARDRLDAAFARDDDVAHDALTAYDEAEERARTEKAAGLSALHDAPLSVLIGPAGTGKTTLLKALVSLPGVADTGVLLLAPTGKARVQLETKVQHPARTLASHLSSSGRYEGDTGRYVVVPGASRTSYGLVIIDEASMLTEEMLAATLDSLGSVKRLILVGDPRQLPPIGAGRPFVDLVRELRPAEFENAVHVAQSYVELQVPRRQLADGSQGTRHDLELAAWFGDGGGVTSSDDIWSALASDADRPTVRYVPWGDRTPLDALTEAMSDELDLDQHEDPAYAFALTYGGEVNGPYLNWEPGAGSKVEDWQILSPTRSRATGSVELNRHLKRTYRADETARAQKHQRSNIASPIGPELIVRGDKVIQTQNKKKKPWPADAGLAYVANGEIGVGLGRVVPSAKVPKKKLALKVEFSSQLGATYTYWPTTGDNNIELELAWAVTVHKSQGSEFATTFLMLPARAHVSRELMYTALTRQKTKVVILHEGDLGDLRELSQPWRSDTARRLTDLFSPPMPVSLKLRGQDKLARYDRNLIHVTANGVPVRSKNEVIVAGLLEQLVPGRWIYEQTLVGSDGTIRSPDFTILLPDGRTVYWEHLGMLDVATYAEKWEAKKSWYADNGILSAADGGGPSGTLMWTEDRRGADAAGWLKHARAVLGEHPVESPDDGPVIRRPAKKTAAKHAP